MLRFRRQNMIWLGVLTGLTALALVAGTINPAAQVLLLTLLAAAFGFSLFNSLRPEMLLETVQQRVPLANQGNRQTPQAREALDRASKRGMLSPLGGLNLLDIGLIATRRGEDGMLMRRTRSISKDDQGVRPFLMLYVPPSEADRTAKLRFEMIDQSGREVYIHEMNCYLRDGEVSVTTDDHLPLSRNQQVVGNGTWDLRVYLDGQLLGMHEFTLAPSEEERINRLGGKVPQQRFIIPESHDADHDEDIPMSLEDLLRDKKRRNG